ncbi:MAG: site-specific integrase [Ammonifex sp.]|jgi:integrase|nr:MAG: site-specific integrase [Ammonifex sp.]
MAKKRGQGEDSTRKERKRGQGEGSIRKRKDGTREARLTIGVDPETGKQKQISKYFKTRREAQEWLAKAVHERATGAFVEPNKVTLKEWLDRWLKIYAKQKVAVTSFDFYGTLIRCQIVPAIGHIELQKLKPIDVQEMYAEKMKNGRLDGNGGLSAETVRRIHNVLHGALKQAVKEGYVSRNIIEAVEPPKANKEEVTPLAKKDTDQFLSAVQEDRLYALFVLALTTGLRRGELLSLRWQDVDLNKRTVTVRYTLARAKQEEGPTKTALIFKEPKTAKSRRTVPLTQLAAQVLKTHKARQAQERLFFGQAYQDNGLVFATEDGRPIDPRNFTRRYTRLMKKAKVGHTRFHNWRHTFATVLLELGEHPKVVQEMLGHSKIATTLDTYSHITPGLMEQAVAKLDAVYGQKGSPSS